MLPMTQEMDVHKTIPAPAATSTQHFLLRALLIALVISMAACSEQEHLDLASPWFSLDGEQVALQVSSTGWLESEQRRISHREIGPKVLAMIANAQTTIVASAFLFDNFYSEEVPPWDVVQAFTDAIIAQKARYPDLVAALILDPSNRAYSTRVAPAVARLSEAGVDVFYSDLLATSAHTPLKLVEAMHHGGRALSQATGGWLGRMLKPLLAAIRIPFVGEFDNHPANLQMLLNAGLVKANHRKLIVTDRAGNYEALISSANPHNASVSSTNFSVSVTGQIARYIHNIQRLDIAHSLSLEDSDYVYWHRAATETYQNSYLDQILTPLPMTAVTDTQRPLHQQAPHEQPQVRARFLTETKIKDNLLALLAEVRPQDAIRIQMFYLSDIDVINALMHAATITREPIRLLLDPSKDAFGKVKDGTPNRQVAALLTGNLEQATLRHLQRYFPTFIQDGKLAELNLELRWFNTHGEQNHAKIMSITNAAQHTYVLLQGSANWTGKNLAGTNMEANIRVDGSPSLVGHFNATFDRFFYNRPPPERTSSERTISERIVSEPAISEFSTGEHSICELNTDDHSACEQRPVHHEPGQAPPPDKALLVYSVPYHHAQYHVHSGIGKWINGEKFGFVSW